MRWRVATVRLSIKTVSEVWHQIQVCLVVSPGGIIIIIIIIIMIFIIIIIIIIRVGNIYRSLHKAQLGQVRMQEGDTLIRKGKRTRTRKKSRVCRDLATANSEVQWSRKVAASTPRELQPTRGIVDYARRRAIRFYVSSLKLATDFHKSTSFRAVWVLCWFLPLYSSFSFVRSLKSYTFQALSSINYFPLIGLFRFRFRL